MIEAIIGDYDAARETVGLEQKHAGEPLILILFHDPSTTRLFHPIIRPVGG